MRLITQKSYILASLFCVFCCPPTIKKVSPGTLTKSLKSNCMHFMKANRGTYLIPNNDETQTIEVGEFIVYTNKTTSTIAFRKKICLAQQKEKVILYILRQPAFFTIANLSYTGKLYIVTIIFGLGQEQKSSG